MTEQTPEDKTGQLPEKRVDEHDNNAGRDRPVMRFFGYLVVTVGGLICATSGLCAGCVFIASMPGVNMGELEMVLLFGGIPFAIGVGCIYLGRFLIRTSKELRAENQLNE